MIVFLTGGGGMVGKNVLEHPRAHGIKVLAPPREELNLLNQHAIEDFLKLEKPDAVIHSAGVVGGIQANMAEPVRFLVDNLQIGLNVINASRQAGVAKFINLGSSCMYPRDGQNPLKEESILSGPLEPTNEGYALAKITAARLCDYIRATDRSVQYKTVIPCNLYGRHDKFEPSKSHMIPAVIRKISEAMNSGVDVVDIWGDGTARREFMYASDLADFLFYALDNIDSMPGNLNVGMGQDHSINEYYAVVAAVLGFKGEFRHDLSKPTGMAQKLVDINKLETFGWKAKTDLATGIANTYEFFKNETIRR